MKTANCCSGVLSLLATVIVERIKAEPYLTLQQLKEEIFTNLNIDVYLNTVKICLKVELLSLKAVKSTVQNMKRPGKKGKRSEYIDNLSTARSYGRALIWIDETNFYLFCKKKK